MIAAGMCQLVGLLFVLRLYYVSLKVAHEMLYVPNSRHGRHCIASSPLRANKFQRANCPSALSGESRVSRASDTDGRFRKRPHSHTPSPDFMVKDRKRMNLPRSVEEGS